MNSDNLPQAQDMLPWAKFEPFVRKIADALKGNNLYRYVSYNQYTQHLIANNECYFSISSFVARLAIMVLRQAQDDGLFILKMMWLVALRSVAFAQGRTIRSNAKLSSREYTVRS